MPKFFARAGIIVALLIAFLVLRVIDESRYARPAQPGSVDPPPLPTCTDADQEAAFAALPDYHPSDLSDFVRVQEGHLALDDTPFSVRGVNYYPSRYPWRKFLTQTDAATIDYEFTLLQSARFNTLRVFLWNEALFMCPGSGAVPVAEAFLRFDTVVQQAAAYGFRLIVTLNDLPDLTHYPLYANPPHVIAQTRFIIERYRGEAAILAWDLRNEGDIDYGSLNAGRAAFSRETVLNWLDQTAALVRSLDDQHLITAGWLHNSEDTIPYVDVVSFHHWSGVSGARDRITTLQAATGKPVLLQEFGYSTQRIDLETQAYIINEMIEMVEAENAAGWLIWTAFDFPTDATCDPPHCPSEDTAEHHFGVWKTDYTPKPAVNVLILSSD